MNAGDANYACSLSVLERARFWWRDFIGAGRPGAESSLFGRGDDHFAARISQLLKDYRREAGSGAGAREAAFRFAAIYREASSGHRAAMLEQMSRAFAPESEALRSAFVAMQNADGEQAKQQAEGRLRIALGAPRARFLAQFNLLPDGVKFVVDMRADIRELLPTHPSLEVLLIELESLLSTWFDTGFLELSRISWRSPAAILEKLIAYEAVQPIDSWSDLRNRLDTDRRCYAFFHRHMPGEPLIFVEIALLKGMPASMQQLLDQSAPIQDPQTADTAIFYSISNTQRGLRGMSLGNPLLKRVIADLRSELPRVKVFATFSPLPGFRDWLDRYADDRTLAASLACIDLAGNPAIPDALRRRMEKACARYLLSEKSGLHPLDPVANFHLGNGASVSRIFWRADTSIRGMQQSYGMMASYRYDLDSMERNRERFSRSGDLVVARAVRRLLA